MRRPDGKTMSAKRNLIDYLPYGRGFALPDSRTALQRTTKYRHVVDARPRTDLISRPAGPRIRSCKLRLSCSPAQHHVSGAGFRESFERIANRTPCSNGASTITTTVSGGFSSTIALSASGQPSGVAVSFTSTLSMTVGSAAATGTYTITVTGVGGTETHSATVSLTITPAVNPNFTISASPASVSVTRGGSGTSKITATIAGGFGSANRLVRDWSARRRDRELQSHVYLGRRHVNDDSHGLA